MNILLRLNHRLVFVSMCILAACAWAEPQLADAACTNTNQCANDRVCLQSRSPLGIGRECLQMPCNADSDCPTERRRCLMGICQATGGNPGGGTGGGIALGGEGETCGPVKVGPVTKSRGCKPMLQCVRGRCQRPQQ